MGPLQRKQQCMHACMLAMQVFSLWALCSCFSPIQMTVTVINGWIGSITAWHVRMLVSKQGYNVILCILWFQSIKHLRCMAAMAVVFYADRVFYITPGSGSRTLLSYIHSFLCTICVQLHGGWYVQPRTDRPSKMCQLLRLGRNLHTRRNYHFSQSLVSKNSEWYL